MIVDTDHQFWEFEKVVKEGKFKACLIKKPDVHKRVTFLLVQKNIPFHRVNYGAGVVRIIKNKDGLVCDRCMGTGVLK